MQLFLVPFVLLNNNSNENNNSWYETSGRVAAATAQILKNDNWTLLQTVNDSETKSCLNGGTVITHTGFGISCHCPPKWFGANCERIRCDPNGKPKVDDGKSCECKFPFTGKHCDTNASDMPPEFWQVPAIILSVGVVWSLIAVLALVCEQLCIRGWCCCHSFGQNARLKCGNGCCGLRERRKKTAIVSQQETTTTGKRLMLHWTSRGAKVNAEFV